MAERVEMPLPRLDRIVATMDPGTWRELPGDPASTFISREDALRISRRDEAAAERLWGWGGPKETFNAFSGAAFDGRRMYFFGGGHHHYRGNDIKVYDLKSLSWSRLYEPAYVTNQTFSSPKRYVPEVGPRSVHTYDGLIYSPKTNELYLWGSRARRPWVFDLDTFEATGDPWQAWTGLDWWQLGAPRNTMFFQTALRPDGKILLAGMSGSGFATVFDPVSRTYGPIHKTTGTFTVMAWDSARNRAYTANHAGGIDVYDSEGVRVGQDATKAPAGLRDDLRSAGLAYDSARERLTFWAGNREIWTWSAASDEWQHFTNRGGPAPELKKSPGTWSKWAYVPQSDAFVGMAYSDQSLWVYKPAASPKADPRRDSLAAKGFTCADNVSGWECPDLQAQVDSGTVRKGIYNQCAVVDGPVDFNGSQLRGRICGKKAALIARDGAVIRNVEISDIRMGRHANCIRWAGGDVALHNIRCTRADMGILGVGRSLLIADSVIENTFNDGAEYGHVVYIDTAETATIRDTVLRNPGKEGHVLKTGAATTIIESSTLEGGERPYSRVIDAFNGGRLLVRDTELRVGAHGGNGDLIGYGGEMRTRHRSNEVLLKGGLVDCRAAFTWHSLKVWPRHVTPESVTWEPDRNLDCPRVR